MDVTRLDESQLDDYHALVRESPYGDVLQTAAWARLKARFGWKPHYFAVTESGSVKAACLALEKRLPRLPFSLLYCPRGPVLDWSNPAAFQPLLAGVREAAEQSRAILIKMDPPAPAETEAATEAMEQQGLVPVDSDGFGGIQPRCVMKLDLSPGLEQVLASFKPKWRYNIRLAERKGVTVRQAGGEEMDAFYDILIETAARDRFLVRGRAYFHAMWEELSKDNLIRLFLAEYEGKVIAGALLYIMGNKAWYTYGASSNEHRNVMPNHLMQWKMMEAAASEGCAIYDFRGVSCKQEEDPDDHLQGLNRFKAGFNARFIPYIGEFDYPLSRPLYFGWTKAAPAILRMIKRRAGVPGGEQAL